MDPDACIHQASVLPPLGTYMGPHISSSRTYTVALHVQSHRDVPRRSVSPKLIGHLSSYSELTMSRYLGTSGPYKLACCIEYL
jgi:hypothetical protein